MYAKKLYREFTVAPEQLATAVGSGSVEVLATPMVAMMMEHTAAELARSVLEEEGMEGFTTVGSRISLTHEAPSPVGARIGVTAVLEVHEGRKFQFSLEARDPAGCISRGSHDRVAVRQEGFAEKARERLQLFGEREKADEKQQTAGGR